VYGYAISAREEANQHQQLKFKVKYLLYYANKMAAELKINYRQLNSRQLNGYRQSQTATLMTIGN